MKELTKQALAYFLGDGVRKNARKALVLFEEGATLDDADCLYFAGVLLQDGLAGRFDRALAFDYIERAAAKGHIDATYCLGYFYLSGGMSNLMYSDEILNQKRVIRDEEKAIALLKQAAEHEHPHAILHIARFYSEKARADPKFAQEAIEWYSQGVHLGEASCMVDMADLIIRRELVKEDLENAKRLYEGAAKSEENASARNAAIYRLENFHDLKNILKQ